MEIKPENVCHIIFKARQLNAIEAMYETGDDYEGDAEDLLEDVEAGRVVHEEREQDPTYYEIKSFIDQLSNDDQCELIALAWLGRGDSNKTDWEELLELAKERRSNHTAAYLLAMPMLGEYLQDALDQFDISCEDFEDEHG